MATMIETEYDENVMAGIGMSLMADHEEEPAPFTPTPFPTMDSHVWVVRDDKIIDFHFVQYEGIKIINNLHGKPVYLPAPETTQKLALGIFQKVLAKNFLCKTYEENADKFVAVSRKMGYTKPRYGCCLQNAIIEQRINGGQIVFGSMGWKQKKDDKIWWEYGGENYLTWKDFAK